MNLSEIKTYEGAVSYCLAVPRFTKKNDMEYTRAFFKYMKSPGTKAEIIHIAGTNGKGSVSAFLQSICLQSGKKVGMFTSPHLCDIRERIRIDGQMCSEEDFLQGFLAVKEALFAYREEYPEKKEYHPTFFEMLFFIGMICFGKEEPDVIILETGLGGRLDATNIIEKPALCVITEIGFDHMEYLGDNLATIAGEKAGIIKPGVPVVYWKENEEVFTVIEEKAKSLSSPCIPVSKDDVDLKFFGDKYIDFSYNSRYYDYVGLRVNTKAVYQTLNASLAVCAALELWRDEVTPYLAEAIASMRWEGRMEEVLPGVFFDGAHNEDGIGAFLTSVEHDGCKGVRSLLFSVVQDKESRKMADMIVESGLFAKIYTAPIASDRSVSKEVLEELFGTGSKVYYFDTPEQALDGMLCDRGTEDYLYVAGSLYLIGQLKEWLKELAND